jgi:predicted TPR repeat methyltransferase
MLDDVLGRAGQEVEVEDILGEDIIMPAVKAVVGKAIKLTEADRKAGSLPSAIKAAAKRQGVDLPDGWKASVAIHLVSEWAETRTQLPDAILTQAETLFKSIAERFAAGLSTGVAMVAEGRRTSAAS